MIRDMPYTTAEQVLRLRRAALGLERERDELSAYCEKLNTIATRFLESSQEVAEVLKAAGAAPNLLALAEELESLVDDIEALGSPLSDPLSDTAWQPIETIPTDGNYVLVWADDYDWPEVVTYQLYAPEDAEEIGEPGYWRYAEGIIDEATDGPDVEEWTHWMAIQPPTK